MDKISGIVRSNSRTASVDLQGSSAVRPGAPSFGRPVGASSVGSTAKETTAAKAVALHNEMSDARKANREDQIVTSMADQFFMSRVKPSDSSLRNPITEEAIDVIDSDLVEASGDGKTGEVAVGFTPRGSYLDIQA